MKKKLLIILPIVLIIAVAGFKMTRPKSSAKLKVNGTIYILPKQFTLNLKGGQYATLTAALLLPPGQSVGASNPKDPPPTGFGTLTDGPVIRAIITNDVTDQPSSELLNAAGRAKLQSEILSNIKSQTDTKVTKIYFTDLAVQ